MLNEPAGAGLRERLLLLRRVNSFGRLSEHSMRLLAENARVRLFPAGTYALREGDLDHVYVVASGQFEVTRDGKPVTTVNPGGVIGVVSMLARDTHGVSARAVVEAQALELPVDVMLDIFEESSTILRTALRIGSQQMLHVRGHGPLFPATIGPPRPAPESELGLVERAIELSEHGMFAEWNANAIFDIARTARELELAPGQALWSAGEFAGEAFHVVAGELVCAERCRVPAAGPGAMLGLAEMFAELPRIHTPIARTRAVVLGVLLEDLYAALDTHRDLAFELLARLSRPLIGL